jgi:hypothetical protein
MENARHATGFLWPALVATAATWTGAAPPVMAASAGCDYWDRFESADIRQRLEDVRERWLAIQPTEAQVEDEFLKEVKNFQDLGYNNAQQLAAGQGVDFYVRRIRMDEYQRRHGEPETDEELWVYCLSGGSEDCADFFARQGRPAQFDESGALAEEDSRLRAELDGLRQTVSEFNMYSQIVFLTYCDCDGSDDAISLCEDARRMLFRDF